MMIKKLVQKLIVYKFIVLFGLVLSGCETPPSEQTIQKYELTEDESRLLTAVNVEGQHIYNITLPEEQKIDELEYSIEVYEKGKLVDHVQNVFDVYEKEKPIRLYFILMRNDEDNESKDIGVSVHQGGGQSYIKHSIYFPEAVGGSTSDEIKNQEYKTNKPIILAYKAYAEGTFINPLPGEQEVFEESDIEKLIQMDYVIVFKCKLISADNK